MLVVGGGWVEVRDLVFEVGGRGVRRQMGGRSF